MLTISPSSESTGAYNVWSDEQLTDLQLYQPCHRSRWAVYRVTEVGDFALALPQSFASRDSALAALAKAYGFRREGEVLTSKAG